MDERREQVEEVQAELFDFVDEFLRDVEAGRRFPLSHYLRRYARAEEAVAREWLRLTADADAGAETAEEGSDGGDRLGPYRLLRELGRGGQGVVWEAEDRRIGRRVALKVLAPGSSLISESGRLRLRREAEVVGRLDHPGICAVYEAELDGDTPYVAMRLVEGETLAARLARAREGGTSRRPDDPLPLGPRSTLELFRVLRFFERAARALHAAHEAGVVHRDVKPGNLMVTPSGEPVVLDFGQARDESASLSELTRSGDIFGTPAYMSPEQLRGDPLDRRTDVWSLGVSLFEALSLRRPFEGRTPTELARAISLDPTPDVRAFAPAATADVAVVLETALEKDVARRYPSALEFAEDLRRICEYEPIRARPASLGLRLARWARRRPALATAIAGVVLAVVAGLVTAVVLLDRERAALEQRGLALGREKEALARERAALAAKERALVHAKARHLAERTTALVHEDPSAALVLGIRAVELEPNAFTRSALLEALSACRLKCVLSGAPARRAIAIEAPAGGTRVALVLDDGTLRLFDAASGEALHDPLGPGSGARVLAPSPDGEALWVGTEDGEIVVVDVASGALVRRRRVAEGPLTALALDPTGARWVAAMGDGVLVVGSSAEEAEPRVLPSCGHPVSRIEVDRAGRRALLSTTALAAGGTPLASVATIVDLESGEPLARLDGHGGEVRWAEFSPDGARVVTASDDGTVRLWSAIDGRPLGAPLEVDGTPWSARFDPAGERLAIGGENEGAAIALVWHPESGSLLSLEGHSGGPVASVAWSPDGTRLVTCAFDTTARVWDPRSGVERARLRALYQPLEVRFLAGGEELVTRANDRRAYVWYAGARPDVFELVGHEGAVTDLAVTHEGRLAVTASEDGTARVWALAAGEFGARRGEEARRFGPFGAPVLRAQPLPGRDALWLLVADGTAVTVDLTGRAAPEAVALPAPPTGGAVAPTGRRAFVIDRDGRLLLVPIGGGGEVRVLLERGVSAAAWSPRDTPLVAGTTDGVVRLVPLDPGEVVRELPPPEHGGPYRVRGIVFRPDGGEVAVGLGGRGGSGRVRLLDPQTLEPTRPDLRPFDPRDLQYDPSGTRLVVVGRRGAGARRLFDLASGGEVRQESYHRSAIRCAAFSPGGDLLVTASLDGEVHVSDARDGRPFLRGPLHGSEVTAVVVDRGPWGERVLSAGADGRVRIWPVDPLPAARSRVPRDLQDWEVSREQRLAAPLEFP